MRKKGNTRMTRGKDQSMKYLTSALSLNMLGEIPASIEVREVSLEEARMLATDHKSVVGHPDTAGIFTAMLGMPVPFNRDTITLKKGDCVLVGQYRGTRLPEGAKTLPEGATIQWFVAEVR